MPDLSYRSLTGAQKDATLNVTAMVNSLCKLFKQGFVPTVTSPLADFSANECDFDGYAAKTIAAFATPVLGGTGYITYAPTQTFAWTLDVDAVGNSVGGYWLETAANVLMAYTIFDPARAAQGPGQAIIVTPTLVFPAG